MSNRYLEGRLKLPVKIRRLPLRLIWILLAAVIAILASGVWMRVVQAQVPTPLPGLGVSDDQVNAVAKDMYCPVCESTPLDVCPTQACAEWRELIRQMLAEGQSEGEIKDYFVDRFGPQVLSSPPAEGLNLMIYVIPPLIILAGVFVLYSAFRSWQRKAPALSQSPLSTGNREDEYMRRLEDELRRQ